MNMKVFQFKRCRFFLFVIVSMTSVAAQQWKASTTMKKLPNGLTGVVSEDHTAPTFGVCVSYGIGFRLEPEGRCGVPQPSAFQKLERHLNPPTSIHFA
jgi:hypothetical protein